MADSLPEAEVVTTELIHKAIQLKEGHDDISIKSFSVHPGSGKGDNYVCVVLAVEAKTQQGDEEKDYQMIFKTTSSNIHLKYLTLQKTNMFYTEAMTYKVLIPDMMQYQKQNGLQPIGPSVPQYYHSVVDDNSGILILEDLHQEGYTLANRRAGLDNTHCKIVMKELGVFHALSWALKNRNPENLKKYDYLTRDSVFATEVPVFFSQALESTVNLVKHCSDNEEVRSRVEKLLQLDLFDVISGLLKPEEPYAVICHGDAWCNNLLFRYDQKAVDISPTNVKLIDFQVSRYALPTTDLVYFFFTSTTRDTRRKYQNDLLRLYHSSFMECLDALGVSFPEFTFEVLERQFAKSSLFGVLMACTLLPLILSNPDDALRFDTQTSQEEFDEHTKQHHNRLMQISDNNVIIKERLIAAVEDAIELKLI